MNDAVPVCPHCGARRDGVAVKAMSRGEIGALLAIEGLGKSRPTGLVQTLVLPHPETRGTARAVELALTVACLPMVACGALAIAIKRRNSRYAEISGELAPVVVMSVTGGLAFGSALTFVTSISTALAVVGASIAGLVVRGVIRARASTDTR
jgi:hypothetical protein